MATYRFFKDGIDYSRMREIAFHTLFSMVSMVSILLTMQKKIHVRK
jgi:hypothetical protein